MPKWQDFDDEKVDRMDFEGNPKWILPYVLDYANNIRVAIGIGEGKIEALPKGRQGSPRMCVLARALSNGWETSVRGDESSISHSKSPEGFDIEATHTALVQMGYKVTHYWSNADDDGGYTEIVVKHPPLIEGFISYFDGGYFPDLEDYGLPEIEE